MTLELLAENKLLKERSKVMRNSKDCLMCSNSFSADDDAGNQVLICVEHDNIIVDPEKPACDDFN